MATEIVEEAEIVGVHAPGGSWNPSCSYASIETLFTVEVDKVTNAVSIVRQLVESEHVVGRAQCWSRSFDDMDAARLCFDWLSSDPDRMILLAATATTVGSGWVDGLVLTGLASYADRLAQNEIKAAAERERIEAAEIEARRRAERISVYFEDRRGEAVLKMERGSDDEPFWQIVFEQKWERARFLVGEAPVVYVELEQACTVKRMWSAILHGYGDEYWDEGTLEDMRVRALGLIRDRRTDLLVLDEVQHLFHRSKDGIAATDAIKRLLDAGVCSLALMGDLDGRRLLESNVQLVNRMVTPADVRVLDGGDKGDMSLLTGFLRRYDLRMTEADLHPEPSGLDDPRVVAGLMDAGTGLLGVMVNLIREASDHAHLRDARRIEPYDLSAAARGWSGGQGRQKHNPFLKA